MSVVSSPKIATTPNNQVIIFVWQLRIVKCALYLIPLSPNKVYPRNPAFVSAFVFYHFGFARFPECIPSIKFCVNSLQSLFGFSFKGRHGVNLELNWRPLRQIGCKHAAQSHDKIESWRPRYALEEREIYCGIRIVISNYNPLA